MAFLYCVVFIITVAASSAMYIQNQQSPSGVCLVGPACRDIQSRSYVNNAVFCCPGGGGMSVSSINNNVRCICGPGSIISNGLVINGVQMNATQMQPMLNNLKSTLQQNFQQMAVNFQQHMRSFEQQMAALSSRLSNMFRGW